MSPKTTKENRQEEILLIYDKECPACDNYCQVVQINNTVGKLVIVNARENSTVMDEITAAGYDIDQGMILKMGNEFYYGSEAIHALALISSRSGVFNRINYWFFKSKTLSHIFYPILKMGRNILLKLLRKTKINNHHKKNNQHF